MAVVVVLAAVQAALGDDRADPGADDVAPTSALGPVPVEGAPLGWERLEDLPLTPRATAATAWTGEEVLVLGGSTFRCPPGADCSAPTEAPLRDGAALDPDTGTWRPVADAPMGFAGASTAVLGDDVYLRTRDLRPTGGSAFLRYSVEDDTWTRLPDAGVGGELVATDDRLVLVRATDERGEAPDRAFDPAQGMWSDLPDDPLPPSFDRTAQWDGSRLYLFGKEVVPSPGSEKPAVVLAARLDPASGSWERLPDSEIIGFGPWLASEGQLTLAALGGADGGEVNGWGREYPSGGAFLVGPDRWRALPPPSSAVFDREGGRVAGPRPPPEAGPLPPAAAGAFGREAATYQAVASRSGDRGPLVLDVTRHRWLAMEPLPGSDPVDEHTVVAAGRDAVVVGGVRWAGQAEGRLVDDTWIWRPPG
ncbi:hypothetical protein PO878_12370 [Iamia majanohamensis]|uniref:Galactose oxidase n=1 Tax=Iamia majanohamensis TaxID=467976 RepID=A0AAE9Y3F7_9ACTN|nr:hypothetical protein [Iamia majanohamensis]WCO65292.1 hypothetical protein PO878_12370 [Iamia majanohamensis]